MKALKKLLVAFALLTVTWGLGGAPNLGGTLAQNRGGTQNRDGGGPIPYCFPSPCMHVAR